MGDVRRDSHSNSVSHNKDLMAIYSLAQFSCVFHFAVVRASFCFSNCLQLLHLILYLSPDVLSLHAVP